MSLQGITDATSINHNFWERSFLLRRAKNLLRLGDLTACENDCHLLITKFESVECHDLSLVRGKYYLLFTSFNFGNFIIFLILISIFIFISIFDFFLVFLLNILNKFDDFMR